MLEGEEYEEGIGAGSAHSDGSGGVLMLEGEEYEEGIGAGSAQSEEEEEVVSIRLLSAS